MSLSLKSRLSKIEKVKKLSPGAPVLILPSNGTEPPDRLAAQWERFVRTGNCDGVLIVPRGCWLPGIDPSGL